MLEITGIKFMWCLLGIGVVLIGIISAMRRQMTHTGEQLAQSEPAASRRQYDEVNVFKNTPTFFRFGMVVALLLVIFAFNWTTFDREINYGGIPLVLDDDFLIEPPRSSEPPTPPPPPPPPPEIVEVEPEEVEEEVIFEDQTVEVNEVIEAPEPPLPPKPAPVVKPPTPPPPPVIIEEEDPGIDEWITFAEQMPRFSGCEEIDGTDANKKQCAEKKLMQYIYGKIKYPTVARENGIEGLVVISFVVEKDGSISGAEVLRDIGGGCGAEALRVINAMPNWTPGYQRAKPVRVKFNMPVKFQLQG